jgi:threonine aldolase
MKTCFQGDNVAGVSPEIWDAMTAANVGEAVPYGGDDLTAALGPRFGALFDGECTVCPVTSGTAANALALSLAAGPFDAAISHADAHVATSEAGAFEFFSQGGRLTTLPGQDGKLKSGELDRYLAATDSRQDGAVPPRVLTITQVTERGTIYSIDEIKTLASIAKKHGLRVHMDGARIANAIAALGCRPGDMTWRAGVDLLSFGATKNGAMMTDAVVIFDPTLTGSLDQRQRRSGHHPSKVRFMAAQLHAYVSDDLWLRNARAANAAAARLAQGLATLPGFEIVYPVDANMIFLRVSPASKALLERAAIHFRLSRQPGGDIFRLVTSFMSSDASVDELVNRCRNALTEA